MSSNVGICVVSFATVGNGMSDNNASVDGNGGMWIINEVIASLSFLGLQLILESVAAVAAVAAVIASILNITFFMMIEKNAYIVIASLWVFETWIRFLLEQDVNGEYTCLRWIFGRMSHLVRMILYLLHAYNPGIPSRRNDPFETN
jgi:hypothetical protein